MVDALISLENNVTDGGLNPPSEDHSLLFVYGTWRPSLNKPPTNLDIPKYMHLAITKYLLRYPSYPAVLKGNYKLVTFEFLFYPLLVPAQECNLIQGELCWVNKNDKEFAAMEYVESLDQLEPHVVNVNNLQIDGLEATVFLCSKEPKNPVFAFYDIPKNEDGVIDYMPFYKSFVFGCLC